MQRILAEHYAPGDAATAAASTYLVLTATMALRGSAFAASKVVVGTVPHRVAALVR